jgi:hypothetical protein
MPEISFALILSENLNNKVLNISQMESIISVKGNPSPRELQEIRDLVSESFNARRKNINDMIRQGFRDLAQASTQQSRDKIIAGVNADLTKFVARFDKEMQRQVTKVVDDDEALSQKATQEGWQFMCATSLNAAKLTTDGIALFNDVFEAVEAKDVVAGAKVLKSLFDLSRSAIGLASDLRDAWRSLEAQEQLAKAALAKIKATKKGTQVNLSDVKKAEDLLDKLGPKIEALEIKADDMSRAVDEMLKAQSSKTFDGEQEAKALEKSIDETLSVLTDLNKEIKARRKFKKSAESSLKDAKTKAKADASYWVTWGLFAYDLVNDLTDLTGDVGGVWDKVNKAKTGIERLQQAHQEWQDDYENGKEAAAELRKLLV